MDITLIRNGYNLQRRKMYVQNPRNNLRSTVQLLWEQSLSPHSNQIQRQKQLSSQLIKQSYTRVIDKKLEDQLKLNKSSFRVMMAPQKQRKQSITARNYSQNRNNYYDSLNRQLDQHVEYKSINAQQSPIKNSSRSQSLSKSVFGYDIDKTAFQKQSYLSKILNDRLQPYLNHPKNKNASQNQRSAKHHSFTINHPISLQY